MSIMEFLGNAWTVEPWVIIFAGALVGLYALMPGKKRGGRQALFAGGLALMVLTLISPLDYLGMDGGAGVGSGPGNAVGHALALMGSGKVAVSVIGDGDLMQGVTGLWTAARYRIPAVFVVVNNRTHLNDELIQEKIARARGRPVENSWVGQRFSDPPLDIPGIAKSHGVQAIGTVTRVGRLAVGQTVALHL